jgi:aryl-alcohol dehydrogenase-like predicted oxidoreductase
METRTLGTSDLRVSLVGLGCNNFGGRIDVAATRRVVDKALDLGITLFDSADVYGNRGGSETCLGEVLGPRRKDIVLATKFGLPMDDAGTMKGAAPAYIRSALEASLKRLKTDWIDLYQLHRPDPATPIEDTLETLDGFVRAGKVRHIGCSNLTTPQVREAQAVARERGLAAFICCQDEYSLLVRDVENELVPAMQAEGLGLLPYFPLASGLLTGKYRQGAALPEDTRFTKMTGLADRYLTERNWAIVQKLESFCAKRGRTLLELAFSWLAARPTVSSIIAGATRPEQVEANVRAVGRRLSDADLAEIDRLTR